MGYTVLTEIAGDITAAGYTGAALVTITLTPGVWFCSYNTRAFSSNSATCQTFNAYINIPIGIANVSPDIIAYSALTFTPGTVTLGASGITNISLTGSGVITTTTSQIIALLIRSTALAGTITYSNATYMMATRIA